MKASNNNTFNNLNIIKTIKPTIDNQWLDIREQINDFELSQQYLDICQKHNLENKWILIINPQNNSLDQLNNSTDINTSKVLRINTNKVKINIKNIETALSKGNCAAVVLCNAGLNENELIELITYARKGKTQCIVLNNHKTIH
jgi:cell division inhibitor SulA